MRRHLLRPPSQQGVERTRFACVPGLREQRERDQAEFVQMAAEFSSSRQPQALEGQGLYRLTEMFSFGNGVVLFSKMREPFAA